MKTRIIFAFLLACASPVLAQDTTRTRAPEAGMKTERFIDADGDGVCDHRQQGLGFRRNTEGGMKKRFGTTQAPTSGSTETQRKQKRQQRGGRS